MKSPRSVHYIAVFVGVLCIAFSSAEAQQTSGSAATAISGASVVPRLVSFSGVLNDAGGKPISNISGVTFLIYRDEQGGAPLWLETQNVTPDRTGHYSVQLGATRSDGLPADMFLSGEARWLAVQVAGDIEKPRVLLVAVPYAMKAADAETIGGLPPSAFVLAAPAASVSTAATPDAALASVSSANAAPTALSVTTTGGTLNTLPLWTTSTNIQSSTVSQTGTGSTAKIGIGTTKPGATLDVKGGANIQGLLTSAATGTATSAGGKNSQPHAFVASSFNSTTLAAVNQIFQWKAEAAGNNTSAPSGTLNLLFGSGTTAPVETGLKLSNKGIFTFATGQIFPGAGTITGITTAAGSGLTGGVNSGIATLSLLKTCTSGQTLGWNGSAWACQTGSGSGTVTSVGSGTGLTGGPITTTGTISIASGGVGTAQIANAAITNPLLASAAVKVGNLSASGSSNGQVLTSNGSSVSWQNPSVPNPLSLSQSSNNSTISATNGGTGGAIYAQSGSTAPPIYAFAGGASSAVYGQATALASLELRAMVSLE